MAGILPLGTASRQAHIAAKRLVAIEFAFDVQRLDGADSMNGSSYAKSKLVEPQLEMVCTRWLP
jgi:hypothetical protein